MDISLDCRVDDHGPLRRVLAFLHVRFQDGDGIFHHLGRLDDLRKEHLSLAEALPDFLHPGHQRPLDDRYGAPQPLQGGHERLLQVLGPAGDERLPERFLDSASGFARNDRIVTSTKLRRGAWRSLVFVRQHRRQPFRCMRIAAEDEVLHGRPQARFDVVILQDHSRIDDGHVQSGADGVVQENGVHRAPDRIVAPEGEGEVGDAAGSMDPGQVLFDPADRFDEIDPVAVVFRNACPNGQYIDIQDDILRRNADAGEEPVRPLRDGDLLLIGGRLPFLVEGHDDHGGAQAVDFRGLFQEGRLPILETDGVDDTLALGILEPREDAVPVGRVDHEGGLGDGRIVLEGTDEGLHAPGPVQHPVVHVDVDDAGSALDLPGRHFQGGVVIPLGDEPGEFPGTGDVGPFADEGEVPLLRVDEIGLQSADCQ